MGTWRLWLFPLAVCCSIMTNTPCSCSNELNLFVGKRLTQPMYSITSSFGGFLITVIPTRAVRTDRGSFPHTTASPKETSKTIPRASKIQLSGGGKDECNNRMVSKVLMNGDTVANNAFGLNVNGNFTALPNSSRFYLNDTTTYEGNGIEGNKTVIQIMCNSSNVANHDSGDVVLIVIRLGIFFGGIFLILLAGIGMSMARTRCRPEKYEDPLQI
ncbi:hypothetical protein CHS0354_004696 [Potamilus streckersoni]|uniref:Uncharacterized protein n=1 Tax=Potamilus streckersoni TaxID=2493646 RepID=A0AAE0SIU3_9BIVA|nr:hypothetical protein CHS0354_004696 [Potamilus streckersoni]